MINRNVKKGEKLLWIGEWCDQSIAAVAMVLDAEYDPAYKGFTFDLFGEEFNSIYSQGGLFEIGSPEAMEALKNIGVLL